MWFSLASTTATPNIAINYLNFAPSSTTREGRVRGTEWKQREKAIIQRNGEIEKVGIGWDLELESECRGRKLKSTLVIILKLSDLNGLIKCSFSLSSFSPSLSPHCRSRVGGNSGWALKSKQSRWGSRGVIPANGTPPLDKPMSSVWHGERL